MNGGDIDMLSRLVFVGCLLAADSAIAAEQTSAPMTCEAFKAALTEAIHAAGNKVATPNDFKVAFKEDGTTHIRYEFSGIAGLTGDLNCYESDRFQSIDAATGIVSDSDIENEKRVGRVKALASAALCATEKSRPVKCAKVMSAIFHKAYSEFAASKRRGEPSPRGDNYQDFPYGSRAEVSIVQDGISVSVVGPRPQ
jgi:hypothetical protein